jgi:hypothetical protein
MYIHHTRACGNSIPSHMHECVIVCMCMNATCIHVCICALRLTRTRRRFDRWDLRNKGWRVGREPRREDEEAESKEHYNRDDIDCVWVRVCVCVLGYVRIKPIVFRVYLCDIHVYIHCNTHIMHMHTHT